MKISTMRVERGLVVALAVAVGLALGAEATEITWKGGGATSAWSDGTNWKDGAAPDTGDIAVITNGATAYMSSADITYANGRLSKIKLPGADSTLWITNTTEIAMSVPVEGIGKFNVANNCTKFTIGVSNPDFTGPFYFTNSIVCTDYGHVQCFGKYNVITNFVGNGLASFYIFKGGSYYNTFHIFGGDTSAASGKRSLLVYYDADFYGPVYVEGDYAIAPQNGHITRFLGGIHHKGVRKIRMFNKITITGATPCDFQTTTEYNTGIYVSGDTLTLESPLTATSQRIGGPGSIKFGAANLLAPTTGLQNGEVGNICGMKFDLNGFDQQCGTIYKVTANGQTEDNSYITSPVDAPAKLTVYGQLEWYGNQPAADTRFMVFSLRGAASLEMNATNVIKSAGKLVWPKMEIRGCPTKSDTKGGLCVRRGTLTLAEDTYWPNLSRLEAHDEGLLVMNTDGVNTNGFVFVVSNVVNEAVTIASNKHLYAKSAYVGKWLEPGEYGGADAGLDAEHTLPQLGGLGTVHVKEWGGPKGLIFIFK